MRITLSQINPTVGNQRDNLAKIQNEITIAAQSGADIVVFPELATIGYPPRDLLYDVSLWRTHDEVIKRIQNFISSMSKPITVIVGGIHEEQTSKTFDKYNSAFVIDSDQIRVVNKRLLPCYDVFDETRYFVPEQSKPIPIPIKVKDSLIDVDILICEDIWNHGSPVAASWMSPGTYRRDPVSELKGTGPIIVINASPFWHGKVDTTKNLLKNISSNTDRTVIWCNQVGGQDDIVFGGYSMIVSPTPMKDKDNNLTGRVAIGSFFQEDRLTADINKEGTNYISNVKMVDEDPVIKLNGKEVEKKDFGIFCLFSAIKLGLTDYCRRTGFSKITFGASGGIDSAVVGAIAAIALGSENCTAITMPSEFSSEGSVKDSEDLASRCNMHIKNQGISEIHNSLKRTILTGGKYKFKNPVTDENLQPRIRAVLLMAESNDNGSLLLTTGNKSELAVGYCTIYGDMCGGYSLLSDVLKTWVYDLALFINKYFGNLIPENTIKKPPSAELAPGQKDTDTLPPYDKLDHVIESILKHIPINEIKESTDLPGQTVDRIIRMMEIAEYKRSQASIGPKVTERAFGSGRRIPIAKKIVYLNT